jgi:starvation-inducible DNA-binding protein
MLSDNLISRKDKGYMFPVGVNISLATRMGICDELNMCLANMGDLSSHLKQGHWNIKGESFISIHKLLDEIYTGVIEYVDNLAERCIALGGSVRGTNRMSVSTSILLEMEIEIYKQEDVIRVVAASLSLCANILRSSIDKIDSSGDKVTSNILQDMVAGLDKWTWFINSHIDN